MLQRSGRVWRRDGEGDLGLVNAAILKDSKEKVTCQVAMDLGFTTVRDYDVDLYRDRRLRFALFLEAKTRRDSTRRL